MKNIEDIDLKQIIEELTGEKFGRDKKIHSPFNPEDKTPSFAIYFNSNQNKWMFKDFSTDKVGDAIDFVMEYKNCSYKEARSCLGLEVELSASEKFEDKIKDYIEWQLQNEKYGCKLLGIFTFVDKDNNPIYCKAKILKPNGKKETPYYSIGADGKIVNKRNHDEVPYNYFNLLNGIAENRTIIFVEGEKDANTINNIMRNKDFVASSLKNVKDFKDLKTEYMKVYVIGDTGEPGQRYIQNIKKEFIDSCSKFKIINLPGIKRLGDNKDVTDWLDAGHTKEDLFNAFNRSLDLKNKYELQQDYGGVYKTEFSKDGETQRKVYITDFQIVDAKILLKIDEGSEDIILKVKSSIDQKIYTNTDSSKVLNDVRSFKNFLGAKLNFEGERKELAMFKKWLSKYFFLEDAEVYSGAQIIQKNGEISLIASDGMLSKDNIYTDICAENNHIEILNKEKITPAELLELKKKIFRFASPEKTISIIGTIINDLAVYQCMENDIKLHHLFITGESESGKSTIVEKIIAPILNYPLDDKKSFLDTSYAIKKLLTYGNYPIIYDEFKPSRFTDSYMKTISNILRNLYDRTSISKGNKNFSIDTDRFKRPIIIMGEESYPNQEKALITRSCIVYMSKNERTEESSAATFWLIDHKDILNKFGRSLIDEILNMPVEQYKEIRDSIKEKFDILQDRALNIALNIGCGIEIFNVLLERYGLNRIENYEQHVIKNIQEEVLDGGKEAKSVVEQMLILYNDMIEDEKTCIDEKIIKDTPDGLYIRTNQMINEIFRFIKDYGSAEVVPLKLKDFRKQATKAGYIKISNVKQIRVDGKQPWFDLYDREKLKELNVTSIVEPDLIAEAVTKFEEKMFDGV